MRRISAYLIFSLVFLGIQTSTKAQDILVPAGTLLKCTLDEPNFSSATADVGDPVVCHLSSLREFGQSVFPRGSYLGGHLEADIQVPRLVASAQSYERPASYDRPSRPVYRRQHFDRPPAPDKQRSFEPAEADNTPASNASDVSHAAQSAPAQENQPDVPEA